MTCSQMLLPSLRFSFAREPVSSGSRKLSGTNAWDQTVPPNGAVTAKQNSRPTASSLAFQLLTIGDRVCFVKIFPNKTLAEGTQANLRLVL